MKVFFTGYCKESTMEGMWKKRNILDSSTETIPRMWQGYWRKTKAGTEVKNRNIVTALYLRLISASHVGINIIFILNGTSEFLQDSFFSWGLISINLIFLTLTWISPWQLASRYWKEWWHLQILWGEASVIYTALMSTVYRATLVG